MRAPEQTQSPSESWIDAVVCPKCHSADTLRTGAYNVEPVPLFDHSDETCVITMVFDRRCLNCGILFPEQG